MLKTIKAKLKKIVAGLKFGFGNSKLSKAVAIFDLPAGWTCPFARDCKSCAHRTTGRITDGIDVVYRCYAASLEAVYKNVRLARWHNFDMLKGKTAEQMAKLIISQLPEAIRYRIHSSGDFFSLAYFDAWLMVARAFPDRMFYAYTKALPFWIKRLGEIPNNFKLVASKGGTHDYLIEMYGLKQTRVVFDEQEAKDLGLKIDHDDSLAWGNGGDFALLLHGTQPPNTPAAKAWAIIKKTVGGYGKKKKQLAIA